ncbi:hypothetical protein LQU92_03220 [Kocuria sp. LUK]|uniref:hypothetical protein n=1 Tax=Kocuria sp. LUK TaxID=2897828 RepID=UPI001E37D374|nr:hypothetical protein [Kocuria sp. LUK]MCD1144251.1 hypothetical protein [Kocuria sp. LUK]
MSRHAFPYRRPARDAVTAGPWLLAVENEEVSLPGFLPDWDYQLDLALRRPVAVDAAAVRATSGLPDGARIALVVVWSASGPNVSGRATYTELGAETESHTLAVHLPGSDLGGTLSVHTRIVLAEHLDNTVPGVAHRAGSILWSETSTVRLQGDAVQFPMAVIDFRDTAFPDDAPWHLQIGGSLDGAAMGALLLLLNETNQRVLAAFRNAAKPTEADRLVLSTAYTDIAVRLLLHALQHHDFIDDAEYTEGSLGATCADLFQRTFSGRSIADVKLELAGNPGMFLSTLQSDSGLFQERGR